MDVKTTDPQEELAFFEEFVKTPAWKILKAKWKPLVDGAIRSALMANTPDRGFAAGKAHGLLYFLEYPEKHIQTLRSHLKMPRSTNISEFTRELSPE